MNEPRADLQPARGKPAEYGQEIVRRRHRRSVALCAFEGKTVIDFGCGNGAQTIEFNAANVRILALDVERESLNIFAGQLTKSGTGGILPVLFGGHTVPVADSSADIVVCFEVLEHVDDDGFALDEIHRILKPGGEMILSVPNRAWIFETHGARLPLLPWNRVPFFSWLPKRVHDRFANARIYGRGEMSGLLARHRFRTLASEYITAPMDVVSAHWLKSILRRTIFTGDTTQVPFFSTSILFHCAKL